MPAHHPRMLHWDRDRAATLLFHCSATLKKGDHVKPLVATLLVSPLLVPLASFGQRGDEALTRAQVREQIVQLEQAGYTPGSFDPHYPEKIQAAQAKVGVQAGNDGSERATSGTPR